MYIPFTILSNRVIHFDSFSDWWDEHIFDSIQSETYFKKVLILRPVSMFSNSLLCFWFSIKLTEVLRNLVFYARWNVVEYEEVGMTFQD